MADLQRARESRGSRVERWSFALAFGAAGAAAIVLLVAPTVIVLITSFTDGPSTAVTPIASSTAGNAINASLTRISTLSSRRK